MAKQPIDDDEEDDLVRCRRVRETFWAQFESVDAIFKFLRERGKNRKNWYNGQRSSTTVKTAKAAPRKVAAKHRGTRLASAKIKTKANP